MLFLNDPPKETVDWYLLAGSLVRYFRKSSYSKVKPSQFGMQFLGTWADHVFVRNNEALYSIIEKLLTITKTVDEHMRRGFEERLF